MKTKESTQTEEPAKSEMPEAVPPTAEFIKTNTTLLVWFFLTVGGALMALYYARIGYLPDIEWRFSVVYLVVVSFIGCAFGILQLLGVFLPGFIWAEALICDSQLIGIFCYEEDGRSEPSVHRIFRYLGIPFGVNLLIAHLLLPLIVYIFLTWEVWPYFMLVTVPLLLVVSIYIWRVFPRLIHEQENEQELEQEDKMGQKEHKHRVWKYIFWFNLSILLSQTAILLVYYIAQPKGWHYFILTLICTFVVLISNHIVAARYSAYPRQAIVACLVASLLLLVAADRFTPLTERIMALYGYGGEENRVNILVNDEGATVIERLGVRNDTCEQPTRNNLCGAEILSGVGSEYFIKLGDTTFTLPKTMVISRSAKAPRQTARP